jgi:hypothetical protein
MYNFENLFKTCWVRTAIGVRDVLFSRTVQTSSEARTGFYSVATAVLSGDKTAGTVHLHIVPMLRMNGAIPLLPMYAFVASTETMYCWSIISQIKSSRHIVPCNAGPQHQSLTDGQNSLLRLYFIRLRR